MANFCPHCGATLSGNSNFCASCGANLNSAQQNFQNPPQNFQQQPQQNFQQQISTLNLEGKLKENFLKREGRINRLNFFKKFLIMFGVAFVIILAVLPLDLFAEIISSSVLKTIHEIFIKAVSVLITIILPYGVIVRRSHDLPTDNLFAKFLANDDEFVARIMTGLMIAAQLLGIINRFFKEISNPVLILAILFDIAYLVFWLYLVFKKGATGANQFGAEPVN